MGIKRCPYCRALISDRDQYCKNCGTQLLFPEDEEIEEEIPGDKITEDDRQRESSESLTEERLEEELEKEIELEEEPDAEPDKEKEEEIDRSTEEIIAEKDTALLEESEIERIDSSARKKAKSKSPLLTGEEKPLFPGDKEAEASEKEYPAPPRTEDYLVEKIKKEILSESEPEPEEPAEPGPGVVTRIVEEIQRKEAQEEAAETTPEVHPGLVTRMVEELELEEKRAAAESYEIESEEEEEPLPPTFESAELDRIGATTELGKREVEDFFRVLEEKEKEHLKERVKTAATDTGETGEVPSWIKEVKTASTELLSKTAESGEAGTPEKVEAERDELWLEEEEETATEPTMGFPEKLTRSGIKAAEVEEETIGEEDMELEEEVEIESGRGDVFRKMPEPASGEAIPAGGLQASLSRTLPPLGFKNFVKAKIFDLLFLVMFWLVSIWIAARSMQTTIFKLFGLAGSGLLLYLLILTFFYFFLFYFFIGETLGDRLFRESEEEENSL